MKLKLILTMALLGMSAFAALPPYYESVRQMKAVIGSADLASKFGGASFVSAITNGKGFEGFTVFAPVREKACHVDVKVGFKAPPEPFAGPFPIELQLGDLVCEEKWNAGLPPYAESVRILQAILESQDVAKAFGSAAVIENIEQASDFYGYTVTGTKQQDTCHVDVVVNYRPLDPPVPGPSPFDLEVSALYCDGGR